MQHVTGDVQRFDAVRAGGLGLVKQDIAHHTQDVVAPLLRFHVALDTVGDIVREGAEVLVAGNAVFAKGDIRENVKKLLVAARGATLTRA